MLVKKTYSSWKPASKGNYICARHFQENDFGNFHQHNARFAQNALSVLCLVRAISQNCLAVPQDKPENSVSQPGFDRTPSVRRSCFRGSVEVLQYPNSFRGVPTTQWAAGHLILGGKLDIGRRDDLFFWSSPDFWRKIGRHAVCFYGSVETATKLFGRLARVMKHCLKTIH